MLCLLPILSIAQTLNYSLLIPGVGYDSIRVGSTTKKEIIQFYGENYSCDTSYSYSIPDNLDTVVAPNKFIYNYKLNFKTQGLTFYFYPNDEYLYAAGISAPFKAMTKDSIIASISSFGEIKQKYGDCKWAMAGNRKMLDYDSIIFYGIFNDTFPVSSERQATYLNEKVEEIVIFNKRTSSYFPIEEVIHKKFHTLEEEFAYRIKSRNSLLNKKHSLQNAERIMLLKTYTNRLIDSIHGIKAAIESLMRDGPNFKKELDAYFKKNSPIKLKVAILKHKQFIKDSFKTEYPLQATLIPNLNGETKGEKYTSWEKLHFIKTPVASIFAYLTYLENNLIQIQYNLLEALD
jgi:hypothetical protein